MSKPLISEWRHNKGQLCCGTLRIAKCDFDTDPSPKFQKRVMDWICETLNNAEALEKANARIAAMERLLREAIGINSHEYDEVIDWKEKAITEFPDLAKPTKG